MVVFWAPVKTKFCPLGGIMWIHSAVIWKVFITFPMEECGMGGKIGVLFFICPEFFFARFSDGRGQWARKKNRIVSPHGRNDREKVFFLIVQTRSSSKLLFHLRPCCQLFFLEKVPRFCYFSLATVRPLLSAAEGQ